MLNEDYNLRNLDLLLIAETKLDKYCKTSSLSLVLENWNIIARYDSEDESKHMGLILLATKNSSIKNQIKDIAYDTVKRNSILHVQCIIVKLDCNIKIGFVYCRSTPTYSEIDSMNVKFKACQVIMGDVNLSHRIEEDQKKIRKLCEKSKVSLLDEITRPQSVNQLDYVLVESNIMHKCYATSYHNFISDHNSITLRIGLDENSFGTDFKEKITFNKELHLRQNKSILEDND